ncbi:protoporphyrinogen oxidase [Haloferax elongans ATCC BAA-1513]|uniref:Protoporphyrinogen oxidase n=1 Tax=Haloferax elongans ATCC BAA-1513 TaxID=1230453 RepID=M0HHG8_HALEO|nr:menaquinone-dependent protoporphyrinogen IX dehydrogenase [Haloferax elongans]ELZ83177.1 protoporphyrinogen oxidase [Haloferax elongans ATCC BAA-1513]
MISFLVAYGSKEGQTEKIAERIVAVLDGRGHEATAVSVADVPTDLSVEDFDAVLVGSSIHMGKHGTKVHRFVREHREALETRPNAFFQVSLSSAFPSKESDAHVAEYIEEFVEKTGWEPDRIGAFGGALRYSKYGFFTRMIMKRITQETIGETDTSQDYEYTDWDEVEAFATDFAALVEAGDVAVDGDVAAGGEPEETSV